MTPQLRRAFALTRGSPGTDAGARFEEADYRRVKYAYRWSKRFNYISIYHSGASVNPFPEFLRPARTGSFFTIDRTSNAGARDRPCPSFSK